MWTTAKEDRREGGEGRGRWMANTAQANKYRKNFLITFFGLICCENNFAGAVWTARYRSVVQRPLVGYSLHNSPLPHPSIPLVAPPTALPHVTDIKFFAFTSATSPSPISSAKLKCSRQEEAEEKEREYMKEREREIEREGDNWTGLELAVLLITYATFSASSVPNLRAIAQYPRLSLQQLQLYFCDYYIYI